MNTVAIKELAEHLRTNVLDEISTAHSGHIGGAFSICDLLAVLYGEQLNVDSSNFEWKQRDRIVLSKGHASAALYAAMAYKGYFPEAELKTFRKLGSRLQGHPSKCKLPGIDISSGSLGQGLSEANGMALSAKYQNLGYHVYCICGDGELQEGQIWEAAMSAAHYKLDNVILFIDLNSLQIDGETKNVMNVEPVNEKFKSFGWDVQVIDGHDYEAINEAINKAKQNSGKPNAIVIKTIKGKGVSFMENDPSWHGTPPNAEQTEMAREELIKGRTGNGNCN